MSGIVGIYHLNQKLIDANELHQMVEILAHRGPDSSDIWYDGSVGMGHRMLWTTPESLNERLPLVKGNLSITAEARIDNRDELARVLTLPNRPLEKIADSEFILAAYEKWGTDCPDHLLGDFAFSIWDGQQLFCARDHFGVKPFYYYKSDHRFLFASEIKALIRLSSIPCKINEARIADYLTGHLDDKEITSYQDIWRLPPASSLIVTAQGYSKPQKYWALDPTREICLESDEDYAKTFKKLFTEAVYCRLRSAFPIGSHLSGGLDSSSIACTARNLLQKHGKQELHTFSNIFDDFPESDEREYIDLVLNHDDFIPHYIHADRSGPLTNCVEMFKSVEEPTIGNGYLMWGINKMAKQTDVRILLNGFDGDTIVSHGIMRLTEIACQNQWHLFVQEANQLSEKTNYPLSLLAKQHGLPQLEKLVEQRKIILIARAINNLAPMLCISKAQLVVDYCLKGLIPGLLKEFAIFCRDNWVRQRKEIDKDKSQSLIREDFWDLIKNKRSTSAPQTTHDGPQVVRYRQWEKISGGLFIIPLEIMDLMSYAFSIETRYPFLDKRLVEFCLAVPSQQKLYRGWSRVILRRAMENILPHEIQWRHWKKTPAQAFHGTLNKFDKTRLEKLLSDSEALISNYINYSFFLKLSRLFVSNQELSEKDSGIIWSAMTMAIWFSFIESKETG